MDKNNIVDLMNSFFKGEDKKKFLFIIILLIGLFLIFLSSLFPSSSDNKNEKNRESISSSEYKLSLEKSIEDTLSKVSGVGDVKVTITLDGEVERDIAYNETNSSSSSLDNSKNTNENNTSSKDAVMVRNGSSESPFTTKDNYPGVVGVVIVASGANNKTVQYYITKSVEALLELPSYKVVVLPSKNNM